MYDFPVTWFSTVVHDCYNKNRIIVFSVDYRERKFPEQKPAVVLIKYWPSIRKLDYCLIC